MNAHSIHLNFEIFNENFDNVKETTLNHIKTLQNTIKLKHKV